jgi:hypothetical protein
MAVAKIYPEPKRGRYSEFQNETGEFSKAYLSRARTILHHASDLAEMVVEEKLNLEEAEAAYRERLG